MIKIKIKYFAALREMTGIDEESVETKAATPKELLLALKEKYPITLDYDLLKVAINEEYSSFESELSNGDTVVFIPPVAGG